MTGGPPTTQVLINGNRVGGLNRDKKAQMSFLMPAAEQPSPAAGAGKRSRRDLHPADSVATSQDSDPSGGPTVQLDVVVHAMGRYNFGCVWDTKGLQSPNVTLNGEPATTSFLPCYRRCSTGIQASSYGQPAELRAVGGSERRISV